MAMSDAQLMHAEKMARRTISRKIVRSRQSDWKDEAVFIICQFARVGACICGHIR